MNNAVIPASKLDNNATIFFVGTLNEVESHAKSSWRSGVVARFSNGTYCWADKPRSMR